MDDLFFEIADHLVNNYDHVSPGPMMSSPGLKYKGKVFAYYHKGKMGFKLGPEMEPGEFGIKSWEYLSPFRTKLPLKNWFVIDEEYHMFWKALAMAAMEQMQSS